MIPLPDSPCTGRGYIHTERLSVRYGRRNALRDVSLSVNPGEFVLVTGPSGCGKSTLALALVGLIPRVIAASIVGEIRVAGLNPAQMTAGILAHEIGIVFQNPATQLFNHTVEEEVGFAPANLHLPREDIAARVEYALDAIGISHLRGRTVRHLSGGEKQRVAIASVLAMQPGILILDEPTANLDRHGIATIAGTLERLNREQCITIVLIEHRLHPFISLAGRAVVMQDGEVIEDGPPERVLRDPGLLKEMGLRNPWFAIGPRFRLLPPAGIAEHPNDRPPLVELRNVSVTYRKRPALQDIDLALFRGEFVALVGDNGAGKSTLARLLAGILRPKRGKITWDHRLPRETRSRKAGLLFQNPRDQLLCDSVWEEVAFAPTHFRLDPETHAAPALRAAGLTELLERHPLALSIGQQQRTALAATLAGAPHLLILDEPTMGQDWGHLERLMAYLKRLHNEGYTILLISHDEKLVYHYAERVVVLQNGRIIADGAPRPAAGTEQMATPNMAKDLSPVP